MRLWPDAPVNRARPFDVPATPAGECLSHRQNRPAIKETVTMTTQTITTPPATSGLPSTGQPSTTQPSTAAVFRKIKLLTGGYLAISALAVGAIALMRNHPAEVNSSVWTHGIVVAASALGAFIVANLAARGHRGAYRRLRILSVVVVVAIAVIIALPGSFPLWMKAEQGVAGLLMAGVAVLANSRQLRSLFAAK
jgi:hypothetical protein